jgi:Protein required for attachment to host cells
MTPTSLIIVADRGSLKAYRVNDTPTRGPSLQLVQAFDITDAHGRLLDKVSDQAGRFPVGDGGGSGRHMNAIAERTQMEAETDRRIRKELAERIVEIVKSDGVNGWSFAAPSPCHKAITDLLPADIRGRIVEHVKSDLVNTEPAKLAAHFRSLQPV